MLSIMEGQDQQINNRRVINNISVSSPSQDVVSDVVRRCCAIRLCIITYACEDYSVFLRRSTCIIVVHIYCGPEIWSSLIEKRDVCTVA